MSQKTALVAMSGGVDSSVAAALMTEQGFRTIGVTLKTISGSPTGFGCCGSPQDIDDAKRVCESLGLAHYTLDMSELFEDKVIKPFIAAYLNRQTPNPCVECNKSLKFGHLLALAKAWGADLLATGHYAKTENGRLFRAADRAKDQSYFLYALKSRDLETASFPVGDLNKSQVRAKAKNLGLKTADKPESQEICFVPNRDYRSFIAARAGKEAAAFTQGPIKDSSGRLLGRHRGLVSYTVGQRKGLGITTPTPRYVLGMDAADNALIVGSHDDVFFSSFTVRGLSWISGQAPRRIEIEAQIRHRHPPAKARLRVLSNETAEVRFETPQRAPAPGQAAVFYDGDQALGGGIIAETKQ
ncbi:MAG: tRNA 2-thiouridine(34) synthase MnmA [Elusimicrobiota bacterium]